MTSSPKAAGTPPQNGTAALIVADAIIRRCASKRPQQGTQIIGVCGAQGSGKSMLAREVVALLGSDGLAAHAVSLDDFYLSRERRRALAQEVHPLFATRGPPGTHDIEHASAFLDTVASGAAVVAPSFDKMADEPRPGAELSLLSGPLDVLIFEGWCIGASPQSDADLERPENGLEADDDPDGTWRWHVNERLKTDYARLFDRLDMLILLAAPSFEVVQSWRWQQELELWEATTASTMQRARMMDERSLSRFIEHFERLTRHILAEMPRRADLTLGLGYDRSVIWTK